MPSQWLTCTKYLPISSPPSGVSDAALRTFELLRGRSPLVGEDRHRGRVDPLVAVPERLAEHALDAEPGLLVNAAGTRVERVHLQGDPVQAQLLEAVPDDQAGGLGAQPASLARRADGDAEAAALVAWIPFVQHRLAHAPAAGPVDDREVEPVRLVVASGVPLLHLFRCLRNGVLVVDAAGEPEDLRVKQDLPHGREVFAGERAEDHQPAGERGLTGKSHRSIIC